MENDTYALRVELAFSLFVFCLPNYKIVFVVFLIMYCVQIDARKGRAAAVRPCGSLILN